MHQSLAIMGISGVCLQSVALRRGVAQEMEVAREEVSRILHQPHTDLAQLRETVAAQAEHVLNMRAARDAATGALARCRRGKDDLLRLMNLDPPHAPAAAHPSSAGLTSAGR